MWQPFNKYYGKPASCVPAAQETLKKYQKLLPEPLLDFWKKQGWCSYKQGQLWVTDPEMYEEAVAEWVDPEYNPVVFARTAFADLLLWMEGQVFFLDVQYGELTVMEDDIEAFFNQFLCEDEITGELFRTELFTKAVKKLGPLQADECYAFEPVLALGGIESVDHLAKVKIAEHLYLLSQLTSGEE